MGRAIPVEALISGLTDSNGDPLNAGLIYSYSAGTSTPKSLWQDNAQTSAHTNPAELDSQGKLLAFAEGNYKFVIKSSAGATLYTHDNLYFSSDDPGLIYCGASTGSANAYAVSTTVGIGTSIPSGTRLRFQANFTCTGASTLNVNSIGAVAIRTRRSSSTALGDSAIVSGEIVDVQYDGTFWRLMSGNEGWNTWTPTVTGFSANPTAVYRYLFLPNKLVLAYVYMTAAGTSNATTFTISAPIVAATVTNMVWEVPCSFAKDNSSALTAPARAYIGSAGTDFTLTKDLAGASWTNSGTKSANFTILYQRA